MSESNLVLPLGLLGSAASAYAAGMMYSLSHVTIPTVLLSRSESTALTQWLSTYSRGKASVPLISMASSICSFSSATMIGLSRNGMDSRAWLFVAAGITPMLIAPLTIFVLDRTNDDLKAKEQKARVALGKREGDDDATEDTKQLIQIWGNLNALRSLLPLAGSILAGVALYI